MQKKFISSVLVACMLLSITSCNKASNYEDSSQNQYPQSDTSEYTEENRETTNETTSEPLPDIDFSSINYRIIEPFSEGYAWIGYSTDDYDADDDDDDDDDSDDSDEDSDDSDSGYRTHLVDFDGNIHFTINDLPSQVYPVVDKTTWVRFNGGPYSEWFDKSTEWIIDTSGNVTYKTNQNEGESSSEREHVFGYGNGKFVVIRYKNGIDGETYYIGTIDKFGKIIDEFWAAPKLFLVYKEQEAEYLKDNYFRIGDYVYDVVAHKCISIGFVPQYYSYEKNSYNGYILDYGCSSQFTNATKSKKDDEYDYENGVLRAKVFEFADPHKKYPKDLAGLNPQLAGNHYYRHGFYDCEGKRILNIEKYPDCEMWCSNFNSDGYALMIVFGKDKYYYITVIDKQGTEQFEPFRIIHEYSGFPDIPYTNDKTNFSSYIINGKFICQTDAGLCLYDITGKRLDVLVEESVDLSTGYSSDYKPLLIKAFRDKYAIVDVSTDKNKEDYQYCFFDD